MERPSRHRDLHLARKAVGVDVKKVALEAADSLQEDRQEHLTGIKNFPLEITIPSIKFRRVIDKAPQFDEMIADLRALAQNF